MSMLSRRRFLKTSSLVAASFATASQGLATSFSSANESLQFAGIGLGIRGSGLVNDAANFAHCVALCDVDSTHLEEANTKLTRKLESQNKSAMDPKTFVDYREVLQRDDIDFVGIGTPDHWHAKMAIEAMLAGKDVYCEKPLTLTVEEGRQIVEAQKKTKRVFQVGTQQRSDKKFQQAVALVRENRIGQVKRVTCALGGAPKSKVLPVFDVPDVLDWNKWLGPAPHVQYRQAGEPAKYGYGKEFPHGRGHAHFRWWYEYSGGKLTDWGAHHVDIAMWALDKSDGTIGQFSIEPLMVKHPVEFENGMPTRDDQFNVANEFHIRITFADGIELDLRHTAKEDLGFSNGIMFQGDAGRFFVNRGKITGKPVEELEKNPISNSTYDSIFDGRSGRDQWHMQNFIDCIKSRSTPNSDVASHHRHLSVCHVANIAIRLGRKLTFDPRTEKFINDEQANQFLSRTPRSGFETKMV